MHPVTSRIWLAALGVAIGALGAESVGAAGARIAMSCLLFGSGLLVLRRATLLGLVGILIVSAGAGMSRTIAVRPGAELEALASGVPRCSVNGVIVEHNGGFGTLVRAAADCGDAGFADGSVMVDGRLGHPGSALEATGLLVPLGDGHFDRARSRLGASAVLVPRTLSVHEPRSPPAEIAARLRRNLTRATSDLAPARRSLVLGLAIGDDSDMDAVTESEMRAAGLSHLVAVSGSNVAIVVGATAFIASGLRLRTRIALCAVVLAIYVLVVGPEPSVLRAALMGGTVLIAVAVGRISQPIHSLGLALLVLVLLRPASIWSVGLHLSALATAGIVLWTRPLARAMVGWPRWLSLPLAATLAAQGAVAPILIGVFGEIPVLATFANLAVLPVVAPATISALLAAAIGGIAPGPATMLAEVAGAGAGWILRVAHEVSGAAWSTASPPRALAWVLGAAAAGLGAAALRAESRAK